MFFRMNVFMFALFLLAMALPVAAENCAQRDAVATYLGDKFQESRTGAGFQDGAGIVEVWASPDGTWTILLTRADGISCILAAGTHWQSMPMLTGLPAAYRP